MGGGTTGRGPFLGPTADELEQRRRLELARRNQRGRGNTLLTSGTSNESVVSQTLLGQTG
jgi:hypothetical protein